jgi:AcrR family transcriptional regulator
MAHSDNWQNSRDFTSPERMIGAMISLWEQRGNAELSVRLVSQAAGLPVSSIYHHFGTMEHLSVIAQDFARAEAERWCRRRLDEVAPADLSAQAFPSLMAALIDGWAQGERRLAFAWRECQVMAARDPAYIPSLRAWQALWSSFWQQACAHCGLGAFAEATTVMFYGESLLHLMRWRRAVDRACLDETCRAWGEWLAGRLTSEGPWRQFARHEASGAMPELALLTESAERIAIAAANTVEELGMGGLTHRAVAARAGLTLGVVSYNFKTSADLARAAFEMLYRRVGAIASDSDRPLPVPTREEAFEGMTGYDIMSPRLTAMDEVMITVARTPGLISFVPQLRYLRGRSSGVQLQGLMGPERPVSPADAALFSAFASGQRHASVALPEREIGPFRRRTLSDLLTTLDVSLP